MVVEKKHNPMQISTENTGKSETTGKIIKVKGHVTIQLNRNTNQFISAECSVGESATLNLSNSHFNTWSHGPYLLLLLVLPWIVFISRQEKQVSQGSKISKIQRK